MRAAVLADAVLSAVRTIASIDFIPGGEELVRGRESAALPSEGPPLPPVALDAVLMRLMMGYSVRSAVPKRDDVFIWGRLEARLQSPDLHDPCRAQRGRLARGCRPRSVAQPWHAPRGRTRTARAAARSRGA